MTSEAPPHPETPAQPSFDELVAVVTDWLRLLVVPDGVVELRALKCQASNYRKPHTRSGFFDGEHLEEMARRAVVLSRDVSPGVYLTLNPVHGDLLSRRCNRIDVAESGTLATDANITCRRWLLVDVDPVRIADVSSTDAEKAAAWELIKSIAAHLRDQGWPKPIVADSGNGYHLLYRIELPVDDGGLVARCLKALSHEFDTEAVKIDTTVFNPSRIVKLYGTLSRKGDHTPERPHRRSAILRIPTEIMPVPASLLEALAARAPAARTPKLQTASSAAKRTPVAERARKYIAALPPAISGQNGHGATFRAACALVRGFDLPFEQAYPLLEEWNQTHCDPPWNEPELRHKLEDADKKEGERGYLLNGKASRGGHAADVPNKPFVRATDRDPGALPEIDAGSQNLPRLTAECWDAIQTANEPPFLYRYGGVPGRIERDDHGEPIVQLVDEDRMRHVLARVARWTKTSGKGEEQVTGDAMPPVAVVKDVMASPDMPLPVLTRIVEAPVFARDGSLLTTPGYHPASQTFFAPAEGFQVPTVSARPTTDEIGDARGLICDELLVDFPFTDPAERAHAVALLLLPFARDLIDGATPLHLFEKPMPGTGATLLVDMLSHAATGRPLPTMTEGRDEDEWRKRLTAKLKNGPQFLLIDNLKRRLDSGTLSAAITSPTWEDRLLGYSLMMRCRVRCCWLATGNNPAVSSEISRRVIRIRLDAKMDRPWLREEFKHKDLRGWARQNRARLCWAALTLIRAWIAAGRPLGDVKLGMFEDWSVVMGGILQVACIPGFLTNLREFYEASDAEGAQWRSFVAAWWTRFQSQPVKVADLYPLIGEDIPLQLGDGSDQSRKVKLGQRLTEARDRMFDLEIEDDSGPRPVQLCVRRGTPKQGAFQWKLEEIDS